MRARGGLGALRFAALRFAALLFAALLFAALLSVAPLVALPPGASAAGAPATGGSLALRLDAIAQGFEGPVFVTGSGDGSGDLYIVEQRGRIVRLRADGSIDEEPVLDIVDRVLHHEERGLLGLAFHPSFSQNGRFFVTYSRRDDGATSVSEFTLAGKLAVPQEGAASDTPWPSETTERPRPVESTERPLLVIAQPYTTHKGGMLAFDTDGMLLIGTGDGGSGNDPDGHALDGWSLLGKLLRIDVDAGWPYAIPADNGFAADPAVRAEIHAMGLRNPWRFSVDRASGDIYIGDVGQSGWEEVDVLAQDARATSFGWSEMEGSGCLGDRPCHPEAHEAPALAYSHTEGGEEHCAIIGGYAYRGGGGSLPLGTYLFGDHCSSLIWAVPVAELIEGKTEAIVAGRLDPGYGQLSSFGEDDDGELYAVTTGGFILHVHAAGAAA